MKNENNKLYMIGEISKLCNIPIKTLRYYDEINLLKPNKIDEYSKYRYYSNDQLVLILAIKQFKEAGFSLKEISHLLERKDLEYNERKIEKKYKEIDDKINDLLRLKDKLKFVLKEVNGDKGEEDTEIQIKYIPEMYVAYFREKGAVNPEEFTVRYCKLMSLIEKNNFHTTKNVMALYYDNCIKFNDENKKYYDIEVCVPVSETKEIDGLVRKFGGFKAISTVHYGNYNELIHLYKKMYSYATENKYEICGPAIDNYIRDIMSTCNPDYYITELLLPIK
ncbi:MAG TPA: MerR family transcriptional regulator [Clostridium sp.]|nr:MerR family transcriptional regulator [Clostridium sp.]